jgi:hypothetical protein
MIGRVRFLLFSTGENPVLEGLIQLNGHEHVMVTISTFK